MIHTGIRLSENISPELIRMLQKHPDVELEWIYFSPDDTHQAIDSLQHVHGEIEGVQIVEAPAEPDYDKLNLYIGAPTEKLMKRFENDEDLKIISLEGEILGVCELNRKALVRGGRSARMPDVTTMLGSLALMPLAKNLMLNNSVTGTMMVPKEEHRRSKYILNPEGLGANGIATLSNEVLPSLQNSFNSPLAINFVQTGATSFAWAVLTIDFKMEAEQASELYKEFYSDHRHVFFPEGTITDRTVLGTNKAALSLANDCLGRLVVTAAFDARYKASAGNIIHLLNLMFGLDERTGL